MNINAFRTACRALIRGEKPPVIHMEGALALLRLQGEGELTPSALAVGLALCALADPETGLCRASLAEVGERAGISRKKSVAVAIGHLAKTGFLEIAKASGRQNQYRIAPGAETAAAPESPPELTLEPGAVSAPQDEAHEKETIHAS